MRGDRPGTGQRLESGRGASGAGRCLLALLIACALPSPARADPDIDVAPASVSLSLLVGESAVRTVTVSNLGDAPLTFQAAVAAAGGLSEPLLGFTIFFDDIENGIGAWSRQVYEGDDLWHPTHQNSWSGIACAWCGVEALGTYATGRPVRTALITPLIDLRQASAPITLEFYENYETELVRDACMVDVSFDAGSSWTPLRGVRGAAPSGSSGGWILTSLDLSSFAGEEILIRFHFDTGDAYGNDYPGWFFDDVLVTAAGVGWIAVSPTTGTVLPGESAPLDLTVDATGFPAGDYDASLTIGSDDPDEPQVVVPVHLRVTAEPDIDLAPTALDFGAVFVGGSAQRVLSVANRGSDSLVVASLAADTAEFTVSDAGFVLAPRETRDVMVTFAPGAIGPRQGTLTVTSDDPDEAVIAVPLAGEGVVSPDIDVTPTSFDESLFSGGSVARTLRLANAGGADLVFQVWVRSGWIRLSPQSGTVAGGQDSLISVTFDARGLGSGDYWTEIGIWTNDPDEGEVIVPAHMYVTGAPDVAVSPLSLDFGSLYVGASASLTLTVSNAGTDPLMVSDVVADNPDFTSSPTSLTLAPGESRGVTVTFAPQAPGTSSGTVAIESNDPDRPSVAVTVVGQGLDPPDIRVSPSLVEESLFSGGRSTRALTLENLGGDDLSFTVDAAGFLSLEEVLASLDVRFGSVTAANPWRFDFAGGESGSSIYDGGGDMYDGGNLLSTDLGSYVAYTQGAIATSPIFGPSGRYLTRKHPGLFVLAADLEGVSEFRISGNLGADGAGQADGAVLEATHGARRYRGFVKRVFNAGVPSVNHLVIVADAPASAHSFSSNTDDDTHRVLNLAGVTRLYYLLYAGSGGTRIDDSATRGILEAFLRLLGPSWLDAAPTSGTVPAGSSSIVELSFDASGLFGGDYQAGIGITSNDPDEPLVVVPTLLHVTGAPDLRVSPFSLDFGPLYIGLSRSLALTVSNVGTDVLTVNGISVDHPDFGASAAGFVLNVGESRDVTVTFTPLSPGLSTGALTIGSDDPDEPQLAVGLSGEAVTPPVIAVTPAALSASVPEGGQSTETLVIANGGGSPLAFDLEVRGAVGACAEPLALVAEESALASVNLVTGAVARIVSGLLRPSAVEIDPVANLAYVTEYEGGSLARVDLSTGALARIAFGLAGPVDLALSRDGRRAFVVESAGELSEVDLATGAVSTVRSGLISPWGVALDPAGGTAYVAELHYGRIVSVNLTTGSVASLAEGFYDPLGITLNQAGTVLYVAEYSAGALSSVDLATGVVTTVASGLLGPVGVIVDPFETEAHVTENVTGQISNVNLASGGVTRISSGLRYPWGLEQRVCAERFLTVAPVSGTVLPGESVEVQALFDTGERPGGSYSADILVTSNDPFTPLVTVPATLHVIGAPNLVLVGEPVLLESVQSYTSDGARTTHSLAVAVPPGGEGSVEMLADGDYGAPSETATATAEGILLGSAGATGVDCTVASGSFPLASAQLSELVADGTVDVEVQNSPSVNVFCGTNRHTVRLRYEVSLDVLDLGWVYIGNSRSLTIQVRNTGSVALEVGSIASDLPEFVPSASALTIPPRSVRPLTLTFASSNPGLFQGTLTIQSDDPDQPVVTVPVRGEARVPPEIDVTPASFSESLFTGETITRTLAIENSGGSDLTFQVSGADVGSVGIEASWQPVTYQPGLALPGTEIGVNHRGAFSPRPEARSYGLAPARVLLYADDYQRSPGSHSIDLALQALGVPYTGYYSAPAGFAGALASGGWDLVVVDQNSYYEVGQLWSELESYVLAGGRLLVSTFDIDGSHSEPTTLWTTLGLTPTQDVSGGSSVHWWDRTHPLFLSPESVPDFLVVQSEYLDGGDRVGAIAPSAGVAGFTSAPSLGDGAIVISASRRAIVNSFLVVQNRSDLDNDGLPDAVELFKNELSFLLGPDWLSVEPGSGVVPAGTSLNLAVTFEASGLLGGDYDTNLVVTSNDLDEPEVVVPVHLHVTGVPDIAVSPADLDYGQVYVGTRTPRALRVSNVGTDVLTVSSIETDHAEFSADASSFSLAIGESRTVTVSFAPASAGAAGATLTIGSDDPDEPLVAVGLAGLAIPAPKIGVAPGALFVTVDEGGQDSRTFEIGNGGGSPLDFEIEVRRRVVACAEPMALVARSFVLSSVHLVTGAATTVASGLQWPMAVEHDPATNAAYVTEFNGGSLARVDLSTGALARVASGLSGPVDLALTRDGRRAFVVENVGELSEVDLATGAVSTVRSGLSSPWGVALDPTGGTAYVTEYYAGRVLSVSLATGSARTVASGLYGPSGLTLNEAGTVAYVVEYGAGGLSSVDLATGAVTRVASGMSGPIGVIVNAEESKAFVTEYTSGELSTVDIPSGVVTQTSSGLSAPRGIARQFCGTRFVTVAPVSGTVAPGESTEVAALFDSLDLLDGSYEADIVVSSNDPFRPTVLVLATLHVIGAPNLVLAGEAVMVESVRDYATDGARTTHSLAVTVAPAGAGAVEILADGDYGDPSETATATAEGILVGTVGPTGVDCTLASGSFPLTAARLEELAADGTVAVEVQNSPGVNAFCGVNRHTVRLRYERPVTPLEFGWIYTGTSRPVTIQVRNTGSATLDVGPIASDSPEFVPSASALTIPPRSVRPLTVTFASQNPGLFQGTLTLQSNDPDQPVATVPMRGEARVPPEIEVSPASFSESLFTGGTVTRTLTIGNTGGSDLSFEISIGGASRGTIAFGERSATMPKGLADPLPGPGRDVPSDHAPEGYVPSPVVESRMAGARVLLVQDVAPWETTSNGQILAANGIPFDTITTSGLPSTDLATYRVVIVASDQFTSTYSALAMQESRIESFVRGGGVLEFHAAGWGWHGGDASLVTLPGGMHIRQYYSSINTVADPAHPLVQGVPNPFSGTSASHAYFTEVPAGAAWIASDQLGRPDLVVYSHGAGAVVAGGQTFEHGYAYGGIVGRILSNMIPYAFELTPAWLSVDPASGVVPAGATVEIAVTFDATDLPGGDYESNIVVTSNDPDEIQVASPAHLHVTAAPNLVLAGESVTLESVQDYTIDGARTTHVLAVTVPPEGGGTVELLADGDYGDSSETATATAEGLLLGSVGPTGVDCTRASGSFPLTASRLAELAADGTVALEVQNSPNVNAFCGTNRHTVRLRYDGPATALDFGSIFAGARQTLGIRVRNTGSDTLLVSSIASDLSEFIPGASELTVPTRGAEPLTVTFAPTDPGLFQGTLTIESNDPDDPVTTIPLRGEARIAPDVLVLWDPECARLFTGESETRTLTLENAGGSDLTFEIDVGGDTGLEDILLTLDAGYVAVTDAIPNRFDFSEGATGYSIVDGGFDMYDGGNYLSTNLGSYLPYTNGTIVDTAILGPGGRYFTRKYPGLFVLAADLLGVSHFEIDGNLGADGIGAADGTILETRVGGVSYRGFVKRVFNAYDPSVNHLVIVANAPEAAHDFSSNTDSDQHRVSNLSGVTRIYYLLYAAGGGFRIDDGQTLEILAAFARLPAPGWLSVASTSGTIPAGESAAVPVTFDATTLLGGGDYAADIVVRSNDPDTPEALVTACMHVIGVPDIRLSTTALDYGSLYIGASSTRPVTVTNEGTETLVVSSVAIDAPVFATDVAPFSLAVGESRTLAVTFAPAAAGPIQGALTLASNDPDEATVLVSLSGVGVIAPDVALQWDPECARLFTGESEARTLTLENTGGSDLVFEIEALGWLRAAPASGTIPAGEGAQVRVTFDATGLLGGDYAAFVMVRSNDPDEPEVAASACMHVTGAADIRLSTAALDYGPLYIGASSTRTVTVTNGGTDLLAVSAVTIAPADYTTDATPFSLAVGQSRSLAVVFSPASEGAILGTLTFASNDPDESIVQVSLSGEGRVPPEISVFPEAIHAVLPPDATSTRPLTVRNSGGSDLLFQLSLSAQDPPGASVAPEVFGLRILLLTARSDDASDIRSRLLAFADVSAADEYDASVITPGLADLEAYDCVILSSNAAFASPIAVGDVLADYVDLGGGVVMTFASFLGGFEVSGRFLWEGYTPFTLASGLIDGGSVSDFDPEHPIVAGMTGVWGYAADVGLAAGAQGVATWSAGPPFVATQGEHVAAINIYLFTEAWSGDVPLVVHNAARWTSGLHRFVDVTPASGVVPAGESRGIEVAFDSGGLSGGHYLAEIRLRSNDLDEGVVTVPVHLEVVRPEDPDISLSDDALDFGTVPVGSSRALSLKVTNVGGGTLSVLGALAAPSPFSTPQAGFSLEPGERGEIMVTFAPTTGLEIDGILTIRSDDPDELEVSVPLRGNGLSGRPVLTLDRDRLDFGPVAVGSSRTLPLKVTNTGERVLVVESAATTRSEYVVNPLPFAVAPGRSAEVLVTFTPVAVGDRPATLVLTSNDPSSPHSLPLEGTAVPQPDLALHPHAGI